jgi:uncharacterized protein (TIGR02246 family)
MKHILSIGLLITVTSCVGVFAQDVEAPTNDDSAIRTAGEAYVKAFNARDTKALAAFWSPDAVYTNRLTGEQVVGRDAITGQFDALFETEKHLILEVNVTSIQFVSPNVAVEHGMARFVSAQSEQDDDVDYSAVYVRRDGKWLLDRVTDDPKPIVYSHYEQLKTLEWMIGKWVDKDEDGQIVTECNWTKNKNFITRSFTVSINGQIDMSGIQIIGWNAADQQIHSWTFDSDGGVAQGDWSKKKNRWYVKKKGTTADGRRASATNIITCVDNDAFTLQSTQRTVAGLLLPNIDEVMVVRR